MTNLLDVLTDNMFNPLEEFFNTSSRYESSSLMRTDIKENEKEYLFDVELPGFDKKDLSINYEDGYLTISAKKEAKEDKNSKFLRRERYLGAYQRSFYVGEDLVKEKMSASYDNGILSILLPKEDKKVIDAKHTISIN